MLPVVKDIKFELENFVREIETAQRSWGRAIPGSEEKACEGPEARLRGRTCVAGAESGRETGRGRVQKARRRPDPLDLMRIQVLFQNAWESKEATGWLRAPKWRDLNYIRKRPI